MSPRSKKSIFVAWLFLISVFFLEGCGGGGGGGSEGDANSQARTPLRDVTVGYGPVELTLEWDAPLTNVDGSELTDLSGFKVYFSPDSPVSFDNSESVDVGDTTIVTLHGLPQGAMNFSVSAQDSAGLESDLSEEITAE